jgi:hypothetical protein
LYVLDFAILATLREKGNFAGSFVCGAEKTL